jgi:hypothetical protein
MEIAGLDLVQLVMIVVVIVVAIGILRAVISTALKPITCLIRAVLVGVVALAILSVITGWPWQL